MLHKRFVFVSLLAPSLSFASTATDSLANATRDVFDNLDENPAFVNVEGGKSYLRIGKAGGVQAITSTGGYGLGIQVNTLNSALVDSIDGQTAKELAGATRFGVPLALSLGSTAGDIKWGAGLQYQNSKTEGSDSTDPTFNPTFMKLGLNLGMIMGATEASLGYGRDSWKVSTSGTSKTPAGVDGPSKPLPPGMSEQSTDSLGILVRHKMGQYQWFVGGGQTKTNSKFWDGKDTSTQDSMDKTQGLQIGAQREDKLAEGMMLFSKGWFGWAKGTQNGNTKKVETTNLQLASAHGVEVAAASWATLRAGFKAALYDNTKTTYTLYSEAKQGGTSGANTVTATRVLRGVGATAAEVVPTMGVGFKFGNYAIDATLAQDESNTIGFSDKVLGKVEVTAQF